MDKKADLLEDIYAYYWSHVKNSLSLGVIIVPLSYAVVFALFLAGIPGKKPVLMAALLVWVCLLPAFGFFYSLKLYTRYINFIKSIKERWPARAAQIRLRDDFAGSRSVCNGQMRIGNYYSYLRVAHQIVDTQNIVSFRSEEVHLSRGFSFYIYAVVEDSEAPPQSYAAVEDSEASPHRRDLYVTSAGKAKQADALVREATFALKCMQ